MQLHNAQLARIEAETDALRAAAKVKREPAPLKSDPLEESRLRVHNRILDLLGEAADGAQQ